MATMRELATEWSQHTGNDPRDKLSRQESEQLDPAVPESQTS